MMAFSGVTSQCEERGFRRSTGTNFEIAVAVVPAGTKRFSLLRKTTGPLVRELGVVSSHRLWPDRS
jgi:hypothetical protein